MNHDGDDADHSELSPAQRFALARNRRIRDHGPLGEFRKFYDFELDPYQLSACESLAQGENVLVAAPTGAGKTVVGEFAVHLALSKGLKCFYTTPIKALSNQKYHDLVARYGADQVGLLTGDRSWNGEAPIVVMTTEVLRNMLYTGSNTLTHLNQVVLDEVHYLADKFRGAVWEEVIIHLPESVQIAALSATVSNAEEFGQWLQSVRGSTEVIVSEHRPVPLRQLVALKHGLTPLFTKENREVNPKLLRYAAQEHRNAQVYAKRRSGSSRGGGHRGGSGRDRTRYRGQRRSGGYGSTYGPNRIQVVKELAQADLLPAITFVFSRNGCDEALAQCLLEGPELTTAAERAEISLITDVVRSELSLADTKALHFNNWEQALLQGYAVHHAGVLPRFKEAVELLFQRGLVKVVFATETLALGINMPARSVVLERLSKWNGEQHADLTPGEYTQLTGRAGRRGIDHTGHAVVVWHDGLDPAALAGLASTRTYPLRSSFKPTYNMAVNLLARLDRERVRTVLESSFAQFQADSKIRGQLNQQEQLAQAIAGYEKALECQCGDVWSYIQIQSELTDLERIPLRQLAPAQRPEQERQLAQLRRSLRKHPSHQCEHRGAHLRWGQRIGKAQRELDRMTGRSKRRRESIAHTFDRLCLVLESLDYLTEDEHGELILTAQGEQLRHLYGEADLVVSECLRSGVWDELTPTELACVVSTLVYEPRRADMTPPELDLPAASEALRQMRRVHRTLSTLERDHHLSRIRDIEPGFAWAVSAWCQGRELGMILRRTRQAPGDFIRWIRQVSDVLMQIQHAARLQHPAVATAAATARDLLDHGIVHTMMIDDVVGLPDPDQFTRAAVDHETEISWSDSEEESD